VVDRERLNAAVIAAFAEPCVLTHQGVSARLRGVFRAPRPEHSVGGVGVQPPEPVLRVRTTDLPPGDLTDAALVLRTRTFRVGRALPGADGLTELALQEWYP
jgi:hypothetical protein